MPTGVPAQPPTSGKAKISLVLGILAVVCVGLNFVPAFLGLIVGILGVRDIGRGNGAVGGKGLAITGIVLSCLGFLCNCITLGAGVPIGMTIFEARKAETERIEAEKAVAKKIEAQQAEARSRNNLKNLGLAMHNYAATYQDKLPSAIANEQRRPILSVRVPLLPYFEEDALYRSMNLKEPWDGPTNKPLLPAGRITETTAGRGRDGVSFLRRPQHPFRSQTTGPSIPLPIPMTERYFLVGATDGVLVQARGQPTRPVSLALAHRGDYCRRHVRRLVRDQKTIRPNAEERHDPDEICWARW